MFISYETDPAISRCSPGLILLTEIVRDLMAHGDAAFDLGVGEGRYKDETCEAEEPLFDAIVPITLAGRGFEAAAIAQRGLKRWVKQRPQAYALANLLLARTGLR